MRPSSAIILLTAILLGGCNGANTTNTSNGNGNANRTANLTTPQPIKPLEAVDPNFKPCNPYFPLVPGSIAKYIINYPTGIVADLTIVVDSGEEGGRKVFAQRSQIVDRSGGMEIAQTIVRKFACDGERVQILSEKTESNVAGQKSTAVSEFRENSLVMADSRSMSIKGTTWTHTFGQVFQSPDQPPARSDQPVVIVFEVLGQEEVASDIGKFKAVKVNRKIGEGFTVDYYAPGIGLIKRHSKEGASWELKEYSGLKPLD